MMRLWRLLLAILAVPVAGLADEVKYSLCIYSCKDADSGNMFSYQKCVPLSYGIMACPPMPECPAFTSDPYPMASQEQCEQYDCDNGKEPYNSQDPTACHGKLPPPGPSPPPPPPSDPEACKKASLEVYRICSGEEKLVLGYASIPLDCAGFCSDKVKLYICGQKMPCCAGPDCLQECMKLLTPPSCAMITADVRTVDEFNHNCLYTPYKPPADPNQCYRTTKVDEVESRARLTSAQSSRPHFKKYLGLQGLRTPSQVSGKRYQQDLHWAHPETGKVVKLHYDVHHGTSPVFSLDESQFVLGVKCMKPWIKLHISPPELVPSILQELLPGTILAGGREWQCILDGEVRSILQHILEVKQETDGLVLMTEAASIGDVFQNATVSLRVAAFPKGHINEHAWPGGRKLRRGVDKLTAPVPMVGSWWDAICGALKSAWHAITMVARAVEEVVEDIGRVAKAIATGDFSYQKHFDLASMSWNYDPSTKQVRNKSIDLGHGLSCQECFFDFEASVNFDLQITSYKVDHAAVWMEGDAQVLLDAEFDSPSIVDEFRLATVHLDAICTTIAAIPFCLQASMIVDAGFNVSSGSKGKNHARLSASGNMKKGLMYQQDAVHRIDQGNLEPLSDSHFIDVKASQYMSLNLFPKLVLTVDHIGGPIVGIKAILEGITEVSSQECGGPGIYGALNLGLQFSVGGFLSVKIPVVGVEVWNKSFPSLLSLSHSFPITSGCHALGNSSLFEMEGTQPIKNGVVFSGTIPPVSSAAPWCAGSPPLLVSYQISNFDGDADDACDLGGVQSCPQLSRGQSSRWSVPGDGGQSYNPFAYGQEGLATTGRTFAPMTQDSYIRYQQTSEEGKGLPAITYNVEVSSDLSSMHLKPVNTGSCYSEATLYRSAKAAEAAKQTSIII